jgi:3-deoxy-D-manno-octulosonic-acid transferase
VLVPHNIDEEHLANLKKSIGKKVVCYSRLTGSSMEEAEVLLIDTIGLLTSIYSYADIAYVGGAFATGLHNTLEPAVFGIPVITGPGIGGFREAEDLMELKGLIVVNDQKSLNETLDNFVHNSEFRNQTGRICSAYVKRKQGATKRIMDQIHTYIKPPATENF